MDRREFIKSVGVAGSLATGLTAFGGGFATNAATAAQGQGSEASGSAARDAMLALLDVVGKSQADGLSPETGYTDPGVPNWLDTEGRSVGQIYWRYVHPVEKPDRVKTKLVKLSSLG